MTPLIKVKFSELKDYLISDQYFSPYTAKLDKRTITYRLKRLLPSKGPQLMIAVKVMRKTKFVMSCTIDDTVYTDLESLKEKIEYKIKKLAIVGANTYKKKEKELFKYTGYKIYEIKSFNKFIECIDKGYIIITFKIGYFISGKRKGQIHDHGTGFSINNNDIDKLYTRTI